MPLRYVHNSLYNMLRTAVEPSFAGELEEKTKLPLADILRHEANYICFLLTRFSLAMETT